MNKGSGSLLHHMGLCKEIEVLHMCFTFRPPNDTFFSPLPSLGKINCNRAIWWMPFILWTQFCSLTLYPEHHIKAFLPNKLLMVNGRTFSSAEILIMYKIVPTLWGCWEAAVFSRVPGT